MPDIELPKEDKKVFSYNPKGNEAELRDFLKERIDEIKEHRKIYLAGQRNIEQIWQEADIEYQPRELEFSKKKMLISEDDLGLRSRLIKIGEDNWQSNIASPDLYVKVNTALSILADQNPEAVFYSTAKKYENNTKLAYGNWKQSWEISGAKQQLKIFIMNLAKYGTAYLRVYPRLEKFKKKIRIEYYKDEPEKDVYEEKEIIRFNDLCRESLNPFDVWLGETTKPNNPESLEDWYFEKEYTWDKFQQEFVDFKNIKNVAKIPDIKEQQDEEQQSQLNKITVGFYENKLLDIYCLWIPSQNIVLYHSPLPNDEGKLSLVMGIWSLRNDKCPYGIGIYEIIKNDCRLFDQMLNMTIDQVVLSIYKMFFYKGTDVLGENGQLIISPGKGEQVSDPNAIQFLNVPAAGAEAWNGLQFLQDRKDNFSGVTPQLSAKFNGKTLGQDMQAKEAALERMKAPLDFICDALQEEAYITLSWQKQLLSTAEIIQYEDQETLLKALQEFELSNDEIQRYLQEMNPNLFKQDVEGKKYVSIYPEMIYNLDKDKNGELVESKEKRFYRFGLDLPIGSLQWKGIIRIKPQSILAPSKEIQKRMKLELYNLIYPAILQIVQMPQFISILLKPIKQILKAYEENDKDWIDEEELQAVMQQQQQMMMAQQQAMMQQAPPAQPATGQQPQPEEELFVDKKIVNVQ